MSTFCDYLCRPFAPVPSRLKREGTGTSITLTITIEPDDNFKIPDGRDDDATKEIKYHVHNPEDVESGIENWMPNSTETVMSFKHTHTIQTTSSSLLCNAPDAVKLEVYTMDAVKVGEARFVDGEAAVKVGEVPAMYLYIVTYPDGRRESGKTVKN